MIVSAPVLLDKVCGGPGQCSEGVLTYQCMVLGSSSKGGTETQVFSYCFRSAGSFGSDGRVTHVNTAERSEALVTGGGAVGRPVMLPSKAHRFLLLVPPSLHGESSCVEGS